MRNRATLFLIMFASVALCSRAQELHESSLPNVSDDVPVVSDSTNILSSENVRPLDMIEMYNEAMTPLHLQSEEEQLTDESIYVLPDSLRMSRFSAKPIMPTPYALPYSFTGRSYDWHRLWINTAVLSGAFVGTLFVLECLPEDATTWNRAELQRVPLFKRWHDHVFTKGPEWDHDNAVFNYMLHPYAGAVYYMSARSCGFNVWQSFLYSAIISDLGWEFGIEAFMERPSYQDMIITPIVGSAIGEGFYILKRNIVEHDYRLFGSPVLGNVVAFLIDPVNELVGFFDHNPARAEARRQREERGESFSFSPMITSQFKGFTISATF